MGVPPVILRRCTGARPLPGVRRWNPQDGAINGQTPGMGETPRSRAMGPIDLSYLRKQDKPLANSLFVYREVAKMPTALSLNPSEVRFLSAEFESASPAEVLRWAFEQFGNEAAIGTSFQGAGLVTIHQAVAAGIPIPVFTIDTGLLFEETLELKARLERFFGIVIESLVPEL